MLHEITETPSETPAAEKEDKENKDIENDKKSADEKENKDNSKEETGDTKDETKNDKDSSDEEVTGKLEPVEDPEQDKDNTEDTSDDKNSGVLYEDKKEAGEALIAACAGSAGSYSACRNGLSLSY